MYDQYAKELIDLIPELPELNRDRCRRALSAAYFHAIRARLDVVLTEVDQQDLSDTQLTLRGLGDSLESIAIFDALNGTEFDLEIQNSCAFVAAEAFALLSDISPFEKKDEKNIDLLSEPNIYVALESALLYMIGGYDINATSAVRNVQIPELAITDQTAAAAVNNNSRYVLSRILLLCRAQVSQARGDYSLVSIPVNPEPPAEFENLLDELKARFYERIGQSLDAYLDWLGGYNRNGLDNAIGNLQALQAAASGSNYSGYTAFADIYHLTSLLIATIGRTRSRSVVYSVPPPDSTDEVYLRDFNRYLERRARGDDNLKGRPFLWPSVEQYVKDCLPGPSKDAVIAMPTGSGKSFLAELAISHALGKGWVLCLAPTNALAHQIRRDLANALSSFHQVQIRAFVGSEEYTTLTEEQVNLPEGRFIAVMTPEKCALAIRLYPERFAACSLCIFDECHLINDIERGVTADILLAQLFGFAPAMRMILMSAMISNPDELANWLHESRGVDSIPLKIKWRPSRTMRGMLVLDDTLMKAAYENAVVEVKKLPKSRVNFDYTSPLALIAGLSGPWTLSGPEDYRIARLPIETPTRVSRDKVSGKITGPIFLSWKNTASSILSLQFAQAQVPVICFLLSSKHHAFASAENVEVFLPGSVGAGNPLPPQVEAWLSIADAELGVETVLRDLLIRGVAVHTSALLSVEQAASEWMFAHQYASLMFATATLAQGLNLPAIAVVIAGTSMGDPRDVENDGNANDNSRASALILNGFGRAGRPGFSNQGVAVLVTDNPFSEVIGEEADPSTVLEHYPILGESDAAIEIRSPVETFIDRMLSGEDTLSSATSVELALISNLAEYEEENQSAGDILHRTFAAYQGHYQFTPEVVGVINTRLLMLKLNFLNQPDVPSWLNKVAMKAGVEFFHALRMWSAYQQRGLISVDAGANLDVLQWFDAFMNLMSFMPPHHVGKYLADQGKKSETVLTKMRDKVAHIKSLDTVPWEQPEDWTLLWGELRDLISLYLRGASYADIAHVYLDISYEKINSKRTSGSHPIPAVLKFIRDIVDALAMDAGCFLAIQQFAVYGENGENGLMPDTLQALPLCIRNGCSSLGSISWFRFGLRERICAHIFESVFPVPVTLTSDTERAQWVISTRRDWLAGTITADHPILKFASIVIKESGEN